MLSDDGYVVIGHQSAVGGVACHASMVMQTDLA